MLFSGKKFQKKKRKKRKLKTCVPTGDAPRNKSRRVAGLEAGHYVRRSLTGHTKFAGLFSETDMCSY